MNSSSLKPKLLIIGLALTLTFGTASAQNLELNPTNPSNGSLISSDFIDVNATVLDPEQNNVTNTTYNLTYKAPEGGKSQLKTYHPFNDTLDVESENLSDGEYNITFYAEDNQSDTNTSLITFNLDTGDGGGGPGEESGLEIDDQKRKTRDLETPNVAYLGSTLNIQNANLSHLYNLTVGSYVIADNHNATNDISTNGSIPEGRAVLRDENNSNNSVKIDLVRNDSDVAGRIVNGSLNTRSIKNVTAYFWQNGSQISYSNISTDINNSWSTNDTLFEMNITGVTRFWLNISTSEGSTLVPSRAAQNFKPDVSMPRINDLTVASKASLTGNVTNNRTNAPEEGLKVRLRRKPSGGTFYPSRFPKATVPPTKYEYTNSSGIYNFTGLQPGKYIVDVQNYSAARSNKKSALDATGTSLSSGGTGTNDFNVTKDVGNASLKMLGSTGPNIRYGFIISNFKTGNGYMKTGVQPGVNITKTVPNGSYSIIAAKFVSSGGFFPSIQVDSANVFVPEGSDSPTKELGFPKLVTLNGTVTKSGGGAVKNAQVIVENESEDAFYVGRTDKNGDYSLKVQNQTGYTVTVEPGFESSLGENSSNITVSGQTTEDFTLSTGPYIEGYVTSSGSGVGDVEVNAWNGSKNSYGFAETNASGYYRIGGLKKNVKYEIFVQSPPGYPEEQATGVEAKSNGNWKNFTLSSQRYDLNGTVKSGGSKIDAKVTLSSLGPGPKRTNTTSNGKYGFAQVDSGDYQVVIEPDNGNYERKITQITLSSDKRVNFSVSELKTVSGYVKSKGTGSALSDVLVYAYNYSAESVVSDRTDSSGYYSLEVAEEGHNVELYPPRDSSYQYNKTSFSKSEVGTEKNFTLASGVYLDGQVRDPGTANLSGYINLWNRSAGISRYQEFSDGSYNITGLDKSIGYNVYVSTDNSSYGSKRTTVPNSRIPGTRDFNFTTLKGPEVWVTVKSSGGGSIANATVSLNGNQKTTNSQGIVKYPKQQDKKKVTIKATKQNYNSTTITPKIQTNYSTSAGQSSREIQNETVVIGNIQGKLKDVSINVTNSKNTTNISSATVVARSNATGRTAATITDNSGSATLSNILPGRNYVTSVSSNSGFDVFNITYMKGSGGNKTGSDFTLEWEVPN